LARYRVFYLGICNNPFRTLSLIISLGINCVNCYTPYTDVVTVVDKLNNENGDYCIYCDDDIVRYGGESLVYFKLTPNKTYITRCHTHAFAFLHIYTETIIIDEVIREVSPGEDVSQYEYYSSETAMLQNADRNNISIKVSPTHHGAEPLKLIDLNQYI